MYLSRADDEKNRIKEKEEEDRKKAQQKKEEERKKAQAKADEDRKKAQTKAEEEERKKAQEQQKAKIMVKKEPEAKIITPPSLQQPQQKLGLNKAALDPTAPKIKEPAVAKTPSTSQQKLGPNKAALEATPKLAAVNKEKENVPTERNAPKIIGTSRKIQSKSGAQTAAPSTTPGNAQVPQSAVGKLDKKTPSFEQPAGHHRKDQQKGPGLLDTKKYGEKRKKTEELMNYTKPAAVSVVANKDTVGPAGKDKSPSVVASRKVKVGIQVVELISS